MGSCLGCSGNELARGHYRSPFGKEEWHRDEARDRRNACEPVGHPIMAGRGGKEAPGSCNYCGSRSYFGDCDDCGDEELEEVSTRVYIM